MNDLQVFTYENTQLRTIEREDGVWWVLKDVCETLGIVKHTNVAARLDADEKGACLVGTPFGEQNMIIINEPGLYNVILRSDKPEAKDFKRWVIHEVLPAIRNKGHYAMQSKTPAQLIAMQAQVLVDMEQKVAEVQAQGKALEAKVDNAIKCFFRPAQDHWRTDMDEAIKAVCSKIGWALPKFKGKLYDELEKAANCNINARLSRLRTRKKKTGMRYKDAMELTKLDAIAADKHLRAIFEGIVRQWKARAIDYRKGGGSDYEAV